MGQLFSLILEHLYALWPVRIIDADCQGVRFTFGKRVALLQPGLHYFCPGLQEIEKWVVVYQSLDCGLQALETKDGTAISLSINVDYEIRDAVLMRTKFQNFDATLKNIARGIIGEWIIGATYDDLKNRVDDLMTNLKTELARKVYGSGVKIKEVRRDVFTRARPYNLMGGPIGI